jgi:hypothetical protein
MISDPVVRPKIVKAAGSRITAARRDHAISREPGKTPGRARPVKPPPHSKSSCSDNVPVNFEGPLYSGPSGRPLSEFLFRRIYPRKKYADRRYKRFPGYYGGYYNEDDRDHTTLPGFGKPGGAA